MKQDNEPREARETLDSADISQILRLLPHRYPFLMIDRIIDIDGDESGTGIKNVSINEPHFQGHFPGKPIMPGVLLMEGMAQTAGALCARVQVPSDKPRLVYFMSIDSVKFRRPVIPGDQVHFFLKKIHRRSSVWKFSGIAKVDGKTVAEAVLTAMMRDQPADE